MSGRQVIIEGGSYVVNVNDDNIAQFDIRSDNVLDLDYNGLTLSLKNGAGGTAYQHVASTTISSATITQPADAEVTVYALVIGTANLGVWVLYLNNTGNVVKFLTTGAPSGAAVYTKPTNKPNPALGTAVTLTHSEDRVTISYAGYNDYILYASIPGFIAPCLGVLARGTVSQSNDYTFLILE